MQCMVKKGGGELRKAKRENTKLGKITMKSSDQLWFSDILEIFLDFLKFRIKECVKPNLYRTKKKLGLFS